MTLEDTLAALSERRLELLYSYQGYGKYNCNSCGSQSELDYDDERVNVKFEPHSPSCPIGNLLNHVEALKLDD